MLLSDEDWLAFDALVEARSSLDPDVVYGFLPAVAMHPDPSLTPSRWLEVIFADVIWEDLAECQAAFDLAGRVYNHVVELIGARDFAMPTIDVGPEFVDFCHGFMMGLDVSHVWLRDEFARELVEPFAAVAGLRGAMLSKGSRAEQIAFVRDECADFDDADFRAGLYELADEFEATRRKLLRTDTRLEARRPVRRDTPKTGRNDPCPCGSGKKFKRCCAN